jgi:hypothetical protein
VAAKRVLKRQFYALLADNVVHCVAARIVGIKVCAEDSALIAEDLELLPVKGAYHADYMRGDVAVFVTADRAFNDIDAGKRVAVLPQRDYRCNVDARGESIGDAKLEVAPFHFVAHTGDFSGFFGAEILKAVTVDKPEHYFFRAGVGLRSGVAVQALNFRFGAAFEGKGRKIRYRQVVDPVFAEGFRHPDEPQNNTVALGSARQKRPIQHHIVAHFVHSKGNPVAIYNLAAHGAYLPRGNAAAIKHLAV